MFRYENCDTQMKRNVNTDWDRQIDRPIDFIALCVFEGSKAGKEWLTKQNQNHTLTVSFYLIRNLLDDIR